MKDQIEAVLRRIAHHLPPRWRVRLREWWLCCANSPPSAADDVATATQRRLYEERVREEVTRFSSEVVVNDLPAIFHYWSNKHLRPLCEHFGFSYPEDFFARQIEKQFERFRPLAVVSLGAGNCDSEIAVAKLLIGRGIRQFKIACLDITEAMLQRGKKAVDDQGLSDYFGFVLADFNSWKPSHRYDVVLANQSLHHVVNLELLFESVYDAIG